MLGDPVAGVGTDLNNYSITLVPGTLRVLYRWDGYLQPINDTAHMQANESKFKFGQTIPVKFAIKKADGTVVQQAGEPDVHLWLRRGDLRVHPRSRDSCPQIRPRPQARPSLRLGRLEVPVQLEHQGADEAGEYRIFANLVDGTRRHVDICLSK